METLVGRRRNKLNVYQDESEDEGEGDDEWAIYESASINGTLNMINICKQTQDDHFCFQVQPFPSNRKLSILRSSFISSILSMNFISNDKILIKMKSGWIVLKVNGDLVKDFKTQELLNKLNNIYAQSFIVT